LSSSAGWTGGVWAGWEGLRSVGSTLFVNRKRYAGWIAFLISAIHQPQDEVLPITLLKPLSISVDYRFAQAI
jgi:hypothetical protein